MSEIEKFKVAFNDALRFIIRINDRNLAAAYVDRVFKDYKMLQEISSILLDFSIQLCRKFQFSADLEKYELKEEVSIPINEQFITCRIGA